MDHRLSHSMTTHTRNPSYAGTRPSDKASIDEEGKAARRRRSASPRGVRQLQRECDTLVLILEKQRYEGAMRRKKQSEVQNQVSRELDYGSDDG